MVESRDASEKRNHSGASAGAIDYLLLRIMCGAPLLSSNRLSVD